MPRPAPPFRTESWKSLGSSTMATSLQTWHGIQASSLCMHQRLQVQGADFKSKTRTRWNSPTGPRPPPVRLQAASPVQQQSERHDWWGPQAAVFRHFSSGSMSGDSRYRRAERMLRGALWESDMCQRHQVKKRFEAASPSFVIGNYQIYTHITPRTSRNYTHHLVHMRLQRLQPAPA